MDRLTLMTLAAHQPRRAVQYGDNGVIEHAVCALAYVTNPALTTKMQDQSLAGLLLTNMPSKFSDKCYECGHTDLEFE